MAQATDNQSQPEVIEQAVSRKEAEYLADQYQLTYPDCKCPTRQARKRPPSFIFTST